MNWHESLTVRNVILILALTLTISLSPACTSEGDLPIETSLATNAPTQTPDRSIQGDEQFSIGQEIEVESTAPVVEALPAARSPNMALKTTPAVILTFPSQADSDAAAGVEAGQVIAYQSTEFTLESEVEWRPPPVKVPYSLHPDDHYWLARPLPSDSRNYDLEWYPYGNKPLRNQQFPNRVHHGLDFPNTTGTPIFAASDGTVIWAGPMANPVSGVNYYGNTVVILHDWLWEGQRVYTLYAHTLELFVEVGDRVQEGELIAGVGASGEVSGPHLHFEVRVGTNNYNNTRNPALWLAPYEGWGTLAGRFIDNRGLPIHGALVTVRANKTDADFRVPQRKQRTYADVGINSDDIWQENFVVADLPAGEYTLFLEVGGNLFRRDLRINPGQTNFVVVQADFVFVPTPTGTITPSPTGTYTTTLTPEGGTTPTPELDS